MLRAATLTKPDVRAYLDMGTLESGVLVDEDNNGIDDHIDDLRAMRDVMLNQGFVLDEDLKVIVDVTMEVLVADWKANT